MYRSLLALSAFLIVFPVSAEVDTDKLWVPKIYQHHFESMQKAADLAAAELECVRFIKGDILQERTTSDTAFFRFLCRGPEQQTFAILVDNQTFTVTNPLKEIREAKERALLDKKRQEDEVLAQQQQLAEQAELERKQKEQSQYWPLCFEEIQKKLKFMKNMVITSRTPPIPVINMQETFTYSVNFDATSVTGKPLKYRASCIISALDKLQVKVKPRRS